MIWLVVIVRIVVMVMATGIVVVVVRGGGLGRVEVRAEIVAGWFLAAV